MDLGEAHRLLLRRLAKVIAVAVVHALVAGVAVVPGSSLDVGGVREDLLVVVMMVLFGLPRRTGDRVVLRDGRFCGIRRTGKSVEKEAFTQLPFRDREFILNLMLAQIGIEPPTLGFELSTSKIEVRRITSVQP